MPRASWGLGLPGSRLAARDRAVSARSGCPWRALHSPSSKKASALSGIWPTRAARTGTASAQLPAATVCLRLCSRSAGLGGGGGLLGGGTCFWQPATSRSSSRTADRTLGRDWNKGDNGDMTRLPHQTNPLGEPAGANPLGRVHEGEPTPARPSETFVELPEK